MGRRTVEEEREFLEVKVTVVYMQSVNFHHRTFHLAQAQLRKSVLPDPVRTLCTCCRPLLLFCPCRDSPASPIAIAAPTRFGGPHSSTLRHVNGRYYSLYTIHSH